MVGKPGGMCRSEEAIDDSHDSGVTSAIGDYAWRLDGRAVDTKPQIDIKIGKKFTVICAGNMLGIEVWNLWSFLTSVKDSKPTCRRP